MRRVSCLSAALCLVFSGVASQAHANIYQWAYVNPSDPSQGVYQSSTLCPGGLGESAVQGAILDSLDLTQAYLEVLTKLHDAVPADHGTTDD